MTSDTEPSETAPPSSTSAPGDGLFTGIAVLCTALGVARLVAAVADVRWPVVAVGERVIDGAPRSVKEFAITTFGTSDKLALEVGTVMIMALLAIALGRLAQRRLLPAILGVAALGLVGLVAAKPSKDGIAAFAPSVVGSISAIGVLVALVRLAAAPKPALPSGFDRRQFLTAAASVSAVSATAGLVGFKIDDNAAVQATKKAARLKLPTPSAANAAQSTVGASAGHGAAPFMTPVESFYLIDTSLGTPEIDVNDWELRIDGMVEHPMTLTFKDLVERDVIERVITLACVSNEVGGRYVGNQRFLGVPLAPLLEEAGIKKGADQIASESTDGWTCGFPTEVALDGRDAMIAIGMNGKPLTPKHGFPARLVVPGLYGYVSATKWLSRIELTTMDDFDGYWVPRGWSKLGPIKTQSRIDVPANEAEVDRGTVAIAGVAWAQRRGITKVEVRIDGGRWQEATLAADVSIDSWRQWWYPWEANDAGDHTIEVRATDATGEAQTEDLAQPAPDGATGYHTVSVTVR